MLKVSGLWPQTSGVEERGQTSAWLVARALELLDDWAEEAQPVGSNLVTLCPPSSAPVFTRDW